MWVGTAHCQRSQRCLLGLLRLASACRGYLFVADVLRQAIALLNLTIQAGSTAQYTGFAWQMTSTVINGTTILYASECSCRPIVDLLKQVHTPMWILASESSDHDLRPHP